MAEQNGMNESRKDEPLEVFRHESGEHLTTTQGIRIDNTDNSLKVGERDPTLMEDFHFREKMTHCKLSPL